MRKSDDAIMNRRQWYSKEDEKLEYRRTVARLKTMSKKHLLQLKDALDEVLRLYDLGRCD